MADITSRAEGGEPQETTLPLAEERLHVEKRPRPAGRVRVRTVNETRNQTVSEDLAGERISVERVSVGRPIEQGEPTPTVRTEGDVTVIPLFEEELVVTRRLVLKEELRVTRHRTVERVEAEIAVRSQQAVIDRIDPQERSTMPMDNEETDQ